MEEKNEVVRGIWTEIFGEENAKNEDNFFDLGGDSIMALKMSELLKRKGYTISLMDVFDDPTLGGVLAAVRPLEENVGNSTLSEEQIKTYPATVQQKWFFKKIKKDRDQWCEYIILSPKKKESSSPEKIMEYLFEKRLFHNNAMFTENRGLFFKMTNEMPSLINIGEEKLDESVGERIARENISLKDARTCCMAYNSAGDMIIIIHHLFSDAVTVKNIICAVDQLDINADMTGSLYSLYAWEQYSDIEDISEDLGYLEEKTDTEYESAECIDKTEAEIYDKLVEASREWGVTVESILLVILGEVQSYIPGTSRIELERIGRDASGKWDDTCGWLSYSAALDLADISEGNDREKSLAVAKFLSSLSLKKNGLNGSEPDSSLSFNYIGNIDVSISFENYIAKAFGQFSGKNSGRFAPIYFAVYFENGKLVCRINYDAAICSEEQISVLQSEYLKRIVAFADNYNNRKADELNSILEVMGDFDIEDN